VTNKAQALGLVRLLQIEMTQGEDVMPTHTSSLGILVLTWLVRRVSMHSFLQIELSIH
jgi:hypothetical protein